MNNKSYPKRNLHVNVASRYGMQYPQGKELVASIQCLRFALLDI